MKAKVAKPFFDLVEGVDRALNDEFELTAERFAAINERGFGELVVAVEEEKAVEEKPKKRVSKKAKAEEE